MSETLYVNELDLLDAIRARQSLVYGSLDTKRPRAWSQFGWPETVDFAELFMAYSRGGVGHGAVHKLLDKCWEATPRIKQPKADKETAWETTLKAALDEMNGWQKLRDFDRRNMVGRYAGLILRVADGLDLREPMVRGKLVDLVPVYEDQLKVTAWVSDANSPDFGKPAMWQYRLRSVEKGDQQGRPDQWADVHPSRILILAEGAVGGDFFDGVPLLRPGYNALVDLEKIGGGSAEGFLKNSARQIGINFDKDASPQQITTGDNGQPSGKSVRTVLQEQVAALNGSVDSAIVTQGATVAPLMATQVDPEPAFRVAANTFSASVQIPFTILFGQQTGRLASDEDRADFHARCKSRQANELTPMLRALVQRLQAIGIVEAGEFEIEWPPLDAPGDGEKLKLAETMAGINHKDTQAGGAGVFDGNEIRKAAGYEEKPDLSDLPGEGGDDEEVPLPAPGAQPPTPVRRVA